jgi:hypothetical protein
VKRGCDNRDICDIEMKRPLSKYLISKRSNPVVQNSEKIKAKEPVREEG